ncbi:MAG: hypothetical protein LBU22_01175 [Dysgonamonadaceae bacterium]|jgi:hypothetical protein|nr:hypothetical protein [Dysgonamonadaceae bacterium]
MSDENELFEYDEEKAVAFILNYLPQELKEKFADDDIYYILDVICDFYEKNDYLDEDDEEKEEQELIRFIVQQAKKDNIGDYQTEDILIVLRAESAYTDTLDIFD